jgi:hypothetical protein
MIAIRFLLVLMKTIDQRLIGRWSGKAPDIAASMVQIELSLSAV